MSLPKINNIQPNKSKKIVGSWKETSPDGLSSNEFVVYGDGTFDYRENIDQTGDMLAVKQLREAYDDKHEFSPRTGHMHLVGHIPDVFFMNTPGLLEAYQNGDTDTLLRFLEANKACKITQKRLI